MKCEHLEELGKPLLIENPRIWEFDVDSTLIIWDISNYPRLPVIVISGPKHHDVDLIKNQKNINLLVKLSKIGWFIRVHSGSGAEWAKRVVEVLGLAPYVDEICAKPLGRTDDQPPGDGYAYSAFRDPMTGEDTNECQK